MAGVARGAAPRRIHVPHSDRFALASLGTRLTELGTVPLPAFLATAAPPSAVALLFMM